MADDGPKDLLRTVFDLDLSDLFHEPRDTQANAIASRVRSEMEAVARQMASLLGLPPTDSSLEPPGDSVEGIPVEWWIVDPFALALVHALSTWAQTGTAEHQSLVDRAASSLLMAWVATLSACLVADELEGFDETSRDDRLDGMRKRILRGGLVDSGLRLEGETAWVTASFFQDAGTWDA